MSRPGVAWSAYASSSDVTFDAALAEGAPAAKPEVADVLRLGRRLLRGLVRAARADMAPTLNRQLVAHLGPLPPDVAIIEESWRPYDHVNVQAAVDSWLAEPGREHEVVGVAGFQHNEFGLAELLAGGPAEPWGPRPGHLATVNVACGPDGAVRACVACALYLVKDGVTDGVTDGDRRTALLLRGPDQHGMHGGVTLQVVSTEPGVAGSVAARIRRLALEHNVFRGQVLSFGGEVFDPGHTLLHFHRRPHLERSALVLPAGVLEAIERQVVGVGKHRERLLASGQHLKRGLLLYGPPGTGKTHTVRYLLANTPQVTVVQLTGAALPLIAEACSVARALTPSLVVVEDVDLIAEDRGEFPGQHPLLFQLLNEMDGLAEDADVVFVLTTNRADLLEPALATRPGRVDQAIELDLPDVAARRTLLELYRGGLRIDPADLDRIATSTDGVTASFLKELLRRAAVLAADSDGLPAGRGDGFASEPTRVSVRGEHLDAALRELQDTRNAMTRILLGARSRGGDVDGEYE